MSRELRVLTMKKMKAQIRDVQDEELVLPVIRV